MVIGKMLPDVRKKFSAIFVCVVVLMTVNVLLHIIYNHKNGIRYRGNVWVKKHINKDKTSTKSQDPCLTHSTAFAAK